MHGFLGPNGSGKTTTIRMRLGLARSIGAPPARVESALGQVGLTGRALQGPPAFSQS